MTLSKSCRFYGGLGDLVLCLDELANYRYLYINSHASIDTIRQFIYLFPQLKNIEVNYDGLDSPLVTVLKPKTGYSDIIMSYAMNLPINDTFAFHPIGSLYANVFAKNNNLPLKYISFTNIARLKNLIKPLHVLGSKEDIDLINQKTNLNLDYIPFEQQVQITLTSRFFVGIDSFFKTIRLAAGKKTTVILPNYIDKTRDETFINPYKDEGIIDLIYYKSVDQFDLIHELCRTY